MRILILLAAVNFTNILDFMVMMPLGPQLKRVFHLNPTEWSLIIASYTFAAFVAGFASIFFIDRFDRKKFLIFNYIFFLIGTLFCAIANSYEMLIFGRVFAGLFGGTIGSVVLAMVGDVVPPEKRATAMGIVMGGFSAAAALGVPVGIYLGTYFSWHIPFYAIVGVGLIITVLLYLYIPSIKSHIATKSERISGWKNIKDSFTDRNQFLALIFMVVMLFGQFSIIPFLSPYMVANVGFEEQELMYIYLFGGFVSIASSAIIGKLADKHGKTKVFTYLLFISLIPIFIITNLVEIPIWQVILITTSFFIFAGGRMIPGTAIVLATAHPKSRGAFMSIRSSIQQLGAGFAAFIAGNIITENSTGQFEHYNYVGYIAIATSLISLWLIRKIETKY